MKKEGMDQYLDDNKAVERLLKEWLKYDKIVVAYDFDNTVYDFHHEGYTYDDVTCLLREADQLGAHLIVFTASPVSNYPFIEEYLKVNNIPFHSINENPSFIPIEEGRKIYFNILLDDRAGLSSAYEILKKVVNTIKIKRGV
ncbi:hypothetical protein [Paenibacillus pini]|uniref:Hydrolase n=1 Tax=Paenibacillus pini JCM 16418 TaxID=1236976 RepID=W7YQG1_9BACL|nr:hypothetical protein [Paenibacillus pini]GAF10782.1 hypothetical protein JCM16418_5002 [Paenibacillus pini JCM 16418]